MPDTAPPAVIVVLEKAGLEIVKSKKGYELLNAEDHKAILGKFKRNPSECRPDIVHQVLLALLDSPLNKAGKLKVYIHTTNNILIDVHPSIRIPRTYKRFAGLMVQLLHKLQIRAAESSQRLMKVIKNPITQHLPSGSIKIGTSVQGKLVEIDTYVEQLPKDRTIVFQVGSHAHGPCDVEWTESKISVSSYPLSAAAAASRILTAFEKNLGIL